MTTVLIVDDSEVLRAQLAGILQGSDLGVKVLMAKDGQEALPVALEGGVDLVVADLMMPNMDGVSLLRAIRQLKDPESLPVILVTSQDEPGTRNLSFEQGVSDYLTRPFTPNELVARVKVQLRLLTLAKELSGALERFRELSTLDDLTGLPNRTYFLEECRRELARCRRHNLSMTIAALDVDHLRQANSRIGHRAADALLNDLAEAMRLELRAADTLAHFHGGKFAALLPHTDHDKGQAAADRLTRAVAGRAFHTLAVGAVTMSIGIATYPGQNMESIDELLNVAEANLDRAKANGGNRVEVPNAP